MVQGKQGYTNVRQRFWIVSKSLEWDERLIFKENNFHHFIGNAWSSTAINSTLGGTDGAKLL